MRVSAYALAALVALALALYPLTLVDELHPYLFLAALAGAAFLLSLLTRDWVLVGPGAGVLLLVYALALRDAQVSFDPLVVVLAIGALVLLETFDLIPLLGRRPSPEKEVVVAHVRHSAIAVALGWSVCVVVLVAARLVGGGPAVLAAPAAFAALGAVITTVALARRSIGT